MRRNQPFLRQLKDESGISVVEIVVAAGMLLLISVGLLNGFVFSAETVESTDVAIEAGAVLQKEVEAVKALGSAATAVAYHQDVDAPRFGLERLISLNTPQQGLNKITVNVYEHPKTGGSVPVGSLSIYVKDGSCL